MIQGIGDMKIGSLVRPHPDNQAYEHISMTKGGYLPDHAPRWWCGIIIEYDNGDPVVFWNHDFPEEVEYRHQLVLIQ
jgi:hypothetical protein